MSIQAIAWALDQTAGSAAAKLILIKLADNTNDSGVCWPSMATMSRQTELDERTIQRHLKVLEEKGLLRIEPRFIDGVQRSNNYYLNLSPHPVTVPPHPRQDDTQGGGTVSPRTFSKEPSVEPKESREQFEEFWEVYPKKVGKDFAQREWDKVTASTPAEQIVRGAIAYSLAAESVEPRYVPNPARWLSEGRWKDQSVEDVKIYPAEEVERLKDRTDQILKRGKYAENYA